MYDNPDFDEPDECPHAEGWDGPNSETPSFLIGCIMLVFRVVPNPNEPKVGRDFVLVREMELADRDPNGPFPRLPCEPVSCPDGLVKRTNGMSSTACTKIARGWTLGSARRSSENAPAGLHELTHGYAQADL